MKSVMIHDFSRAATTDSPRSTFDRSHGLKTAFDSGYLVPIECQEVLPGDEVNFNGSFFGRLSPTVTPIMDNVFLDTQWFFVPARLLWTNWSKMMGERVNPKDSIDYLCPTLNSGSTGFAVGSLADYLGIPPNVPNLEVNALPFRAVAKIWDDWYRDENLQDSIIQSSDDLGDANPHNIDWNVLRKRGKRHDYFTSALPWTQKGQAIELPLGTSAPVTYGATNPSDSALNGRMAFTRMESGKAVDYNYNPTTQTTSVNPTSVEPLQLRADLSNATAATINSLRMAFQLQRLLETDARCGTRLCEIIRGHFKTVCPDARLQRSEYLGGSSTQIGFLPVAQTAESGETPLGNLVANGKVTSGCHWHKSFSEWGYVIGFANVRCDLNYQQGLDRMWSRRGRYDYFWPVLQNLGEQAVLNKEIYAQGSQVLDENGNPVDDQPFGYQERYAEYRYNPSRITGKMRSGVSGTLDVWHLAQKFDALPTLSKEFIEDAPPLKRALSVTDEPEIILDAYLGQAWTRPMGTHSIPGLVDHL